MSIDAPGTTGSALPDGIYERVLSDELASALDTLSKRGKLIEVEEIKDEEDAALHLSRSVYETVKTVLGSIRGKDAVEKQLRLTNDLLALALDSAPKDVFSKEEIRLKSNILLGIESPPNLGANEPLLRRPKSSLCSSGLLVNAVGESVISELLSEIDSADEIELLCSFIKWSGFIKFRDALETHCRKRRRPLRVLTTVYMGASEAEAIAGLRELGAEVKVSYDVQTTRLHAKAWLFRRKSGYTTAFIGSSNLSKQAMTDGIEWNVRVTSFDNRDIVETFSRVFKTYWQDPESTFDTYESSQRTDLESALAHAKNPAASYRLPAFVEIRPHDFQKRILENLAAARQAGHSKNLVVSATGTGKTVVAALDYRRLRAEKKVDTLLFVAHREEILKQSRELFGHALRYADFGEILSQYEKPKHGRHVFASVQSLARILAERPPAVDSFDMVIIDEVHHAMAPTYRALLEHFKPRILLGLTATPERADGLRLEEYFDSPPAAVLRVWDAIDEGFLVPFNYFALSDGTDLSDVEWKRGKYNERALSDKLLGAEHVWVDLVVRAIARNVRNSGEMRALAFCVDVAHANFVAQRLSARGIKAEALTGETERGQRTSAIHRLRSNGEDRVNVLCTVDLFNEGIDIPEVDTVIFLRPTESATVFLQQLGRGLRRSEGKDSLTVLDFIGRQYERFRFDLRFRALLGIDRGELAIGVKNGFSYLPAGCSLQFEEVAREEVLRSLRHSLPSTPKAMLAELRLLGSITTLATFLEKTGLALEDLYYDKRSWASLRAQAGFEPVPNSGQESDALGNVFRLIHANDPKRLGFWANFAKDPALPLSSEAEKRLARMMFVILYGLQVGGRLDEALELWRSHEALRREICALADELGRRAPILHPEIGLQSKIPLVAHANYSRDELVAAFDLRSNAGAFYGPQTGVVWVENSKHELLLVTLDKSSKSKLPHLQYRDYAISESIFHWDSQAETTSRSRVGQRHIHGAAIGVSQILLVRRRSGDPYTLLGPVKCLRHEGERPVAITWLLEAPMPAELLHLARAASA